MILSTWVYKVRWTCSMCFVVYVTMTIYCGIQTIHHIHVHQHLRDRFSRHRRNHSRTRARLHMGNPWTRVYVRLDPKRKPHHMTPTPTTWWEPKAIVDLQSLITMICKSLLVMITIDLYVSSNDFQPLISMIH